MSELKGALGELRMMLQITRKETGKTDTVELVSTITDEASSKVLDDAINKPKE
jgi:hypothetical protein